jgi:uncharacterized protein
VGPAAAALPPAPTRWVTDAPGVLSPPVRQALDGRLERYQQATGHHALVWIGQLPPGQEVEDWSARAFAAWGVGRKGQDDGVVLFVFPEARRVRIEVGYGLEGQLTDLAASRIIRERLTPRLAQGDWDGAITAGVDGILGTLGGEPGRPQPAADDGQPAQGRPRSLAQTIFMVVVGLFVLGVLITHPSLAVYLLFSIFSGGGRGGGGFGGSSWGGGGGGGYSGGGGRSGGGGASGSW